MGLWPVLKGLPLGLVTTAYSGDVHLRIISGSALPSWGGSEKFPTSDMKRMFTGLVTTQKAVKRIGQRDSDGKMER